MREIKFRVWDVNHKQYIKWWLSLSDGDNELNDLFKKPHPNGDHFDYTIQQYTGVKDKNANEICEGDIVEYTFPNGSMLRGVVSWIAGMFVLDFPDQTDSGPIGFLQTNDMDVIGNIHEHPQLQNEK